MINKINDPYFGYLTYDSGWGWVNKSFPYTKDLNIGVGLMTELDQSGTIPRPIRLTFDEFRFRERSIIEAAAQKCANLENFSTWSVELADAVEISPSNIADHISLFWVGISFPGDIELQYVTGGPFFFIHLTDKLEVIDAYFDLCS